MNHHLIHEAAKRVQEELLAAFPLCKGVISAPEASLKATVRISSSLNAVAAHMIRSVHIDCFFLARHC